jgi:hypothetical protein
LRLRLRRAHAARRPLGAHHTELFTVSGWREVGDDFDAVVSRADSRLIVFRGARNEKGINGNHYYLLGKSGHLKHLYTINTDGNFETTPKTE